MIDWSNVDLTTQAHEKILDSYSFEQLLLEVECNLREINEKTITAQFNFELDIRIETAKQIFKSNLDNITTHATKQRGE